jgi:hypothetical protein
VKVLRQLMLLPVLAPLLAVLLLAAANPRPGVSLRLLLWSSPTLPLGAWIAAAAAGGAGLSAAATALALRQGAREAWTAAPPSGTRASERAATPPRQTSRQAPLRPQPGAGGAGPSRAPGEPAPTVEVPFRVIRRSSAAPGPSAAAARTDNDDGWDQPTSEAWG